MTEEETWMKVGEKIQKKLAKTIKELADTEDYQFTLSICYGPTNKVVNLGIASPTTYVNCVASQLASFAKAGIIDLPKVLSAISKDAKRRLKSGKITTIIEDADEDS